MVLLFNFYNCLTKIIVIILWPSFCKISQAEKIMDEISRHLHESREKTRNVANLNNIHDES